MLRYDSIDSVLWSGDLDNRVKTIIDALGIPVEGEKYNERSSAQGNDPIYCLMEDDKLVTKLNVESDRLLCPLSENPDQSDAKVVITVSVKPLRLSPSNFGFG